MKNRILKKTALFAATLVALCSCVEEEKWDNTPQGNFEALWQLMDSRYCFFDYKADEYGLDWDEVYRRYSRRIIPQMSDQGLSQVLGEMLGELRDGHVNLSSPYDYSRYWSWKEAYAANFSDSLQRIYLGTGYRMAGNIKYTILPDNIGYIYCGSFAAEFGDGNLSAMFDHLAFCTGLIVDVRDNSGGMITAAEQLAGRFTNEKVHFGYVTHKTGSGHSDFSSPKPLYIEPSKGLRWHKPVALLTNRSCYSSANHFICTMRALPNVTQVGDTSGGGGGMPLSSLLPNGWSVRFSACPYFDREMRQIEQGIAPDVKAELSPDDALRGRDTIIEVARRLLREQGGADSTCKCKIKQ